MAMRRRGEIGLSVLMCWIAVAAGVSAQKPIVGFLRVDAAKYYVEEQNTHPYGTRVLRPNGFEFGFGEWRTMFYERDPEKILAMLRQFHVLVLDTPFDDSIRDLGPERQATAAAARQALERYLQEGGGALILLQAVRYPGDMDQDYANLILQGLGVQMLHEGIFDRAHAFTAPIAAIFAPEGFFWTENITPGHPVTEGVRRLVLPQYHNGQTPGVVAPELSPEWEILVRGEASAQSYPVTREHVTDYSRLGRYASAPPIAAVRQFGQGRVMIISVPARSVYVNYGVRGWNMIVESTGNAAAQLPSDGARLVLNGIKWLAETARNNPQLGRFETKPVERVRFPESLEWDSAQFPAPTKGIRGLIGAKTALSEGRGSVAEYVAAAKATGLSFIVFNESLEKMTPEKLEKLKAECRAASTDDFYACPGLEFSDDLGNRWAIWGERIAFPPAQFSRAYGETNAERPPLKQWDGAVMHNPGQYWEYCAYAPNMLLTYRHLRAQGAHPANMWWFYRVPPFVYDFREGERPVLAEDQFGEWLYALRDIRHVNPASYTRVRSPAQVAAAARVCVTGASSLAAARDWLNTRCGNFSHPAHPYVTGGPIIEQWAAINAQHDWPFSVRGKQRARLRFQVSSPDGIAEVKIHNCDYGIIRRFLAHGAKTFAQEFNLVHDRDHTLTLEVVDTKGRRAISDKLFLWSYKMSLQRCGDNLNFLTGVGLCWHPDRNEMMPLAQMYQGPPAEAIGGYDTAVPLTYQAVLQLWPVDVITTQEIGTYPDRLRNGILRKILDVKLPGNDVKICEMEMGPLVEPYDSPTRDTPARTSVPRIVEDNQLFTRWQRTYYLQNRTNMYIVWDYRRAREGTENYRGGLVIHEGKITFKREATLAGNVPAILFYFHGGALEGPTTMIVKDAQAGLIAKEIPRGERFFQSGTIAAGGYASVWPMDEYYVFYAASDFSWACVSDPVTGRINQLQIGLGRPGQKVRPGETISYRFAMATLGRSAESLEKEIQRIEKIQQTFGIGVPGLQPEMRVGRFLRHNMFLELEATGRETALRLPPTKTIVELPICVTGIEDNGCAAVYGPARPWLRWIGVAEGKAWLQEEIERGAELWIGNAFVCDNKAVKLTLIDQGLAPGRQPFLEIHNPTDKPIVATVTSPPHCPLYGGMKLRRHVPAGATIVVPIQPKQKAH